MNLEVLSVALDLVKSLWEKFNQLDKIFGNSYFIDDEVGNAEEIVAKLVGLPEDRYVCRDSFSNLMTNFAHERISKKDVVKQLLKWHELFKDYRIED